MDDSTSEASSQLQSPSVASVLGVKGPLRFRRHGASQKAHVVLRRVDIPEGSPYSHQRGPLAYFSLFAQKRIEVKPGKEILLSVASDDGSFTDQAVIFEGDLCALSDSNSDEEKEVEKQIAHDDTFSDPPVSHIIPPKMRRTWTKQHDQVSPVEDSFLPPSPTYVSVGVQVQPTWSVSAIQVVPPAVPTLESMPPQTPGEPSAPMKESVQSSLPDTSRKLIPPPDNRSIPHDDRSRSLSPMSIGSTSSTPPPEAPHFLDATATPTQPIVAPRSKTPSTASTTRQAPADKLEAPWSNAEDAASRTSQISPISSDTVDMDLQSSPSSQFSVSSDDIPGFITGAASRRARPPSPLVLPAAPLKSGATQTPVLPSTQTVVLSPVSTVATSVVPFTESVSDKLEPTPSITKGGSKRQPIKNPFVSGGFVTLTDIVEKDSVAATEHPRVADHVEQPCPAEPVPVKTEPAVVEALPPSKASPVPQPSKLPVPPDNRIPPSLNQSFSIPSRPPPAPYTLPSRSSDPGKAHSGKSGSGVGKSSYQPLMSANDPRLSYTSTGSISNPLNIRPSRLAPGPPRKSGPRGPSPKSGHKRKVVVGSGWPHNRQANGHAATGPNAISVSPRIPKGPLPVARPLTPESTRSSTTPPGLSGLAPYSSPSPPGFLHGSSAPKVFIESANSTPQIKRETNDWGSPSLSQSPVSPPQSISTHTIQAPRPVVPQSTATSSVLQYTPQSHGQIGSNNSTPLRDSKGKKRALTSDADTEAENVRPRKRAVGWPSRDPTYTARLESDEDPGVNYLAFSSDGQRLAVICNDCTIRIWNMASRVETARLGQNAQIMAVAWMSDDMGVISLGQDGVISKWTRTNQNHWQWAKLLDAGKEDSVCFAYRRDRIAVAFPRLGVKVWIWIKGTWQPQRSILRQNVTSIQFVEDGEALIGGTSDGVLWYCQVPNGTLRAYAFLKAKVYHLDVNGPGTHALVSQAGGRAHLVGIQQTDHKGKIEQVYTANGDAASEQRQNFGAMFASGCKAVLFGTTDGSLLAWDRSKGDVICGLDHGESEQVQAVACIDRGSQASIVTGTKSGVLSWWIPPLPDS